MLKFSYKLQELRKGSGMSQEDFAELLGVSRQSVSKWESGKGYPEIDKLIFISNYFNTSLDLLLKDAQEDANSTPVSEKSIKNKRNSRRIINLTKHSDINSEPIRESSNVNTSNNVPQYMSDPIPNQKKQSLPLQRINVSPYAQVRPVTNYNFGKQNNKLSKKGVLLIAAIGAFAISLITTVRVMVSYNTYDTDYAETTVVADEVTYYDSDWETLYDDDLNSDIEQNMINDINNQSQSILIDKDGKVYYSGYDIVTNYINSQWDMRNALNCSDLYQKYISFQYGGQFLEVYSTDLDEWVIINEAMLHIYPDQYYENHIYKDTLPYSTLDFMDILSSSEEYQDYVDAPFENVYRMYSESSAKVSSYILDLCMQAMEDRKISLNMTQFCSVYETFKNKYELVKCSIRDNDITFVPKEFLLVNVSDLDDNNNVVISESQQVVEYSENIVDNNDIPQEVVIQQDNVAQAVE